MVKCIKVGVTSPLFFLAGMKKTSNLMKPKLKIVNIQQLIETISTVFHPEKASCLLSIKRLYNNYLTLAFFLIISYQMVTEMFLCQCPFPNNDEKHNQNLAGHQ